jgi:glycosyltransferase involved in cell wall biosynthesis
MRSIAFLIPTLDRIGGAERQVILLAKGLARRGWRVSMVALSGTGEPVAGKLASEGVEFLSLEMRKGLADPRGWIRFHRWLHRERPDVVHGHLPHAAWFGRWSRLCSPVRLVLDTIHTSATGMSGRRFGYRSSHWLPNKVTAVSDSVADAYLSAHLVSPERLTVLPNGIDIEKWKPEPHLRKTLRCELGLADEFIWLAAGRLEPVKDYPTLLRSMLQIPSPARLVIAGGGPLEGALRHLAAELGLTTRVQFLGFEPDVLRWMQAADGFVLSSRWEGLPMGLLESAACGLPAVATNVAGSCEIVVHGYTGFLAPAGNVGALAMAMNRLMQMPLKERNSMGQRAQQRVTERYDLERVLDLWESLYSTLLAQNPLPFRWGRAHRAGFPQPSTCRGLPPI